MGIFFWELSQMDIEAKQVFEEYDNEVYQTIFKRRDIRKFKTDPVPDDALVRILTAAHHGPSVGFMQPWNFILIRDKAVKQQIYDSFVRETGLAAENYDGEKKDLYLSLKLEGILESPVNLCVTYDISRFGPNQIGRNSMPEMGVYSVCCAIQNLWLAARSEGIGVGWVSIVGRDDIRKTLGIPQNILPVGYFCIGYPQEFPEDPELKTVGWVPRLSIKDLIYYEKWDDKKGEHWKEFQDLMGNDQK